MDLQNIFYENWIENNIKFDYKVFEAIDGTKFIDETYQMPRIAYPTTAGVYGNQISTEHILIQEISKNSDSFMIFDDDSCFFTPFNTNSLPIDNLPSDWDVIILGDFYHKNVHQNNFTFNKVYSNTQVQGSHGIAVNKRVYKLWLEILQEKVYWGDGTIDRLFQLGRSIYTIYPSICFQDRTLFSDINKIYHK